MRKSRILTAALMGALALGLVYCSGSDGTSTSTDGGTPGKADASSNAGADAEQGVPSDASNVPPDASNVPPDAGEPPDASNEPPDASSGADGGTVVTHTCGTAPASFARNFTVKMDTTTLDFSTGRVAVYDWGDDTMDFYFVDATDSYALDIYVDQTASGTTSCPADFTLPTDFFNGDATMVLLSKGTGTDPDPSTWEWLYDSDEAASTGKLTVKYSLINTGASSGAVDFACSPDCVLDLTDPTGTATGTTTVSGGGSGNL